MHRKPKLGLITISDNRKKAHEMLYKTNKEFEEYAVSKIEERGDIDIVAADTIVHTAREAVAMAKPIPYEAPVTHAIFPLSENVSMLYSLP